VTPQQAALVAQAAHRKVSGKWAYCHITAPELASLADAYLDAIERMAQIETLAAAVLYDCATCYREHEGQRVHEIKRLASEFIRT
jgi:hypothetical protein